MNHYEELMSKLADSKTLVESNRLNTLLTDFIVAARAGKLAHKSEDQIHSSVAGKLAINSSFQDRDDIDWSVMTHPGSIIWPAIFEVAFNNPNNVRNFKAAALSGYRTSASIAAAFGPQHRINWHVSTTAGTLAAASGASVYLGLPQHTHETALLSAASNMGGIARADRRTGAAMFNRAAAASLGILAAESSASNIPSATDIWEGPRSLPEIFSLVVLPSPFDIRLGTDTSGLRLFPFNGFVHGAVHGVCQLRREIQGDLLSLKVGITSSAVGILDGSVGGEYWSAAHSVACAWQSGDEFTRLDVDSEILAKVEIYKAEIPFGGALIEVTTNSGSRTLQLNIAPGTDFSESKHLAWQKQKWESMIGSEIAQASQLSHQLLADDCSPEIVKAARDFLL